MAVMVLSADGHGGTGFSLEEALAYDAQHSGRAPALIEGIAQRLVDGALQHGMPYADVVYAHCVKTLELSAVDQAWILHHWGRIMMRQH